LRTLDISQGEAGIGAADIGDQGGTAGVDHAGIPCKKKPLPACTGKGSVQQVDA
jgi:hypothetical protein